MHVVPVRQPEIAQIMTCSVDKLLTQGVSRRKAVRRIARKHGVRPRQISAVIAAEDRTREVGL